MDIFRLVKGQVGRPNNTPWPKDSFVQIRLTKGSYTVTREFPKCGIPFPIDEVTGDYEALLWASETGEIPTRYEAIYPNGERFEFVVPSGIGELQITALRQASQPVTPAQQNAIFAYIDQTIVQASQSAYKQQLLAVTSANQTAFNLSAIPALPHLSLLFVNGEKSRYPQDFVINSSVLTWNNRVSLDAFDEVEFYYL